jgi:hypothetical protein
LLSLHPEQVDRSLKKLETAQLVCIQPAILKICISQINTAISLKSSFGRQAERTQTASVCQQAERMVQMRAIHKTHLQ